MANYDSIKKKTDAQAAEKIAASNKIYDDQYAATEKIYNQQIEDSNASYAKIYDRANVQRIVNERYAKEMAANMGLSNSGYNRTQQTQIMLSYNNAVLETDYQKAAAANTIRSQLASLKADIEAKKASSALSIQDAYDQQAVNTYNQQVAAEQAAAAARTSAQNALLKQQQSDFEAVKKILYSSDYTNKQKADEITWYMRKYGTDDLYWLLNFAGMTEAQYNSYYSNDFNYTNPNSTGKGSGAASGAFGYSTSSKKNNTIPTGANNTTTSPGKIVITPPGNNATWKSPGSQNASWQLTAEDLLGPLYFIPAGGKDIQVTQEEYMMYNASYTRTGGGSFVGIDGKTYRSKSKPFIREVTGKR